MKKFFLLALLLSAKVVGWSGPETIVVTPQNAVEYQFELEEEDSGEQAIDAFTLRFPAQLENGCLAGRVQTYLFDAAGLQLSGASVDYDLQEGQAEIMLYYQSSGYEF